MNSTTRSGLRTAALSLVLMALVAGLGAYPSSALLQSQRNVPAPTGIIQGVVQSEKGPEAGVWVIAETKDLLTNFIKIVVTDDQGKFLVPDLPAANYKLWVRGYGLVDSTPLTMKPATNSITLKTTTAKTPQEAAKVYPGDYWLSLMEPPPTSLFPGRESGQRPQRQYEDAKPMAQPVEVRLQLLSPARQPADPHIGRRLHGRAEHQDLV